MSAKAVVIAALAGAGVIGAAWATSSFLAVSKEQDKGKAAIASLSPTVDTAWGGHIGFVVTAPNTAMERWQYKLDGLPADWCARLAERLPGRPHVLKVSVNEAAGCRPDANVIDVTMDTMMGIDWLGQL